MAMEAAINVAISNGFIVSNGEIINQPAIDRLINKDAVVFNDSIIHMKLDNAIFFGTRSC